MVCLEGDPVKCQVCSHEMIRWQAGEAGHFILACPVCGRKYDPSIRKVLEPGDRHRVRVVAKRGVA